MSIQKFAVLGYKTINIGDDIQSLVTSTLLDITYIIERDDCDLIYEFHTGKQVTNLKESSGSGPSSSI